MCLVGALNKRDKRKQRAELKSKTKAQDRGDEAGLCGGSKLLDILRLTRKNSFAT